MRSSADLEVLLRPEDGRNLVQLVVAREAVDVDVGLADGAHARGASLLDEVGEEALLAEGVPALKREDGRRTGGEREENERRTSGE